jgi:putative FmdB family regulatory protein
MPKYNYICPLCKHDYIEQRPVEQPQIVTKCNDCGDADYEEVVPVEATEN